MITPPTYATSPYAASATPRRAFEIIDGADLGVFAPAVAVWSRSISNAGQDIRPQVFRNCAAEGAGFVRKGAARGDVVAALVELADRHGLPEQMGGIAGVEATIGAAFRTADMVAAMEASDERPAITGAPSPARLFKLIHIDDIVISDAPLWLIDGLVPAGPSMGVIFGKPKSGKSFLTASMFYHVAMGAEYCGRAVQAGAVVYITNEGIRGFQRRMIVMREHFNVASVPFYVVHTMPYMGTACGDVERLADMIAAAIPHGVPVAAVVIDTLARSMSGKNENSTEDMSVFLDNCDTIAKKLVCFVAAVHHSPRADDTRGRGSNVLDGGADVIISVVKDKTTGVSTATIEEMKDGEAGVSWRFHLVQIEPDSEKHGKPGAQHFRCCGPLVATIGTLARNADSATRAQQRLTPSQRRFIDILAEAILDAGTTVSGSVLIPPGIKAVTRDQLKKCVLDAGFLDVEKAHSARTIFGRMINDLAGKHVIGTTAEHVWLPR